MHLGFNRGVSHPGHVTGELDVAVGINDVMPHVCLMSKHSSQRSKTTENRGDKGFYLGRIENASASVTDFVHQGRDDGERRPLHLSVVGVRVGDED